MVPQPVHKTCSLCSSSDGLCTGVRFTMLFPEEVLDSAAVKQRLCKLIVGVGVNKRNPVFQQTLTAAFPKTGAPSVTCF